MSRVVFRLPDLGEGLVSAEIVSWHVKPGDTVREDHPLVEMSTDKAVVEIPASVTGRVVSIAGEPGTVVAVGAELVVIETEVVGAGASASSGAASAIAPPPVAAAAAAHPTAPLAAAAANKTPGAAVKSESTGRVMASPATRRRAREAGIDLGQVAGSGPGGRILTQDLTAAATSAATAGQADAGVEEIKVIGVRRLIAQRMIDAKRNIPHFSYVEEVDVTALETLRQHLNAGLPAGAPPLTFLPFIAAALIRVLREFPQCNAHYDAERNVIRRFRAVHLGVATQSPDGLKVPVVHDAQTRGLHELAAEIRRVSTAAKEGKATRAELMGSTITITSLGKLGGIASTPIINAPEVSIIGINRAVERPMVLDGQIVIRRMMNLSSSFDHRFVDGFDAAAMIQALKTRLEHPATLFID